MKGTAHSIQKLAQPNRIIAAAILSLLSMQLGASSLSFAAIPVSTLPAKQLFLMPVAELPILRLTAESPVLIASVKQDLPELPILESVVSEQPSKNNHYLTFAAEHDLQPIIGPPAPLEVLLKRVTGFAAPILDQIIEKSTQENTEKSITEKLVAAVSPQQSASPEVPKFSEVYGETHPVKPIIQLPTAGQQKIAATSNNPYKLLPAINTGESEQQNVRPFTVANKTKVIQSGVSTTVNHLEVALGKALIMDLDRGATRITISDPNIAKAVVLSPTQIQLVGSKVGSTNLLVWHGRGERDYDVIDISVQRDVSVLYRQLQQVDPGIKILPMAAEQSVILTGETESSEKAQLAVEIAKAFFTNTGSSATSLTNNPISSQAPGSSSAGATPSVINLIKVKGQPSTKLELVREKLNNIHPGIHLDLAPGLDGKEKAILTGRVPFAGMISRAINLTSIFYGAPGIKVLTGPGGNIIPEGGSSSNSFQDAETFSDNKATNTLQGSVITDGSGNVISMVEVSQKPQIRCRVKILEMSKTGLDQLGGTIMAANGNIQGVSTSGAHSPLPGNIISQFNTEETGAATAVARTRSLQTGLTTANTMSQAVGMTQTFFDGVTQIISWNEKLTAAISALEERRKAKSLAEPTLVALSGEKASFLAGGEIPIPVITATGGVNVEYREFGIRLNIIATLQEDGKINLQVAPEVSALDNANSIPLGASVVPALSTRRMQSTLELEEGQSFVLAGLYNNSETNSVNRFPGIGSLPIIGTFFRNKWNDRRDTEMVVIIQPEVVTTENNTSELQHRDAM